MYNIIGSYMNSSLFKNPINVSERNPYTDSIYGAGVTALYSSRLNSLASRELTSYVKNFSSKMNDLRSSTSDLLETSKDSVYKYKAVKSSSNAVEGLQAANGATSKDYNVKVDSLATAQVNKSAKLESKVYNSFTEGTNSIKISSGSKSTVINFEVKSYHTNKDVLQEVSNKINAYNMNVSSRVVSDDAGSSYLELTSKHTGKSNKLEIEDVSGDFVSKSHIDTVVQNAENAKYHIDGREYESESNDIKIDNGKVSLRLKNVGESKVSIVDDSKAVVAGVKSFAADYNSTLNLLDSNISSRNAAQLRNNIANVMQSRRTSLERIGIKVSDSGRIEVDDEKLSEALKDNSTRVKNVLSTPYNIASKINKLASEALTKPLASFADTKADISFSSSDMYNYMNTAKKVYLGRTMQQGILFDTVL